MNRFPYKLFKSVLKPRFLTVLLCLLAFSSLDAFSQEYESSEYGLSEMDLQNGQVYEEESYVPFEEMVPLRVGIILSDIYSKKDMEFSKGLFLAVDQSQLPPNSLALRLFNGELNEESLMSEINLFEPEVILTTHDKDVPEYLLDFAQRNGVKLLNVFDTKGDAYLQNPSVYELLPPSANFNRRASEALVEQLVDCSIIVIGEPEKSDVILRDLISGLPENDVITTTKESLRELEVAPYVTYAIYISSANSNEVKDVLEEWQSFMADYPDVSYKIIGRPNWVAYNDLNSIVSNLDVYIPSKCYFDMSTIRGKRFISDYNAMFGHSPIRAFPVYSVMGYDVGQYFLPILIAEKMGNYADWSPSALLQSGFNIVQANETGGWLNDSGFLLHFEPWGNLELLPLF